MGLQLLAKLKYRHHFEKDKLLQGGIVYGFGGL